MCSKKFKIMICNIWMIPRAFKRFFKLYEYALNLLIIIRLTNCLACQQIWCRTFDWGTVRLYFRSSKTAIPKRWLWPGIKPTYPPTYLGIHILSTECDWSMIQSTGPSCGQNFLTYCSRAINRRSQLVATPLTFQAKTHFLCVFYVVTWTPKW